MRQDTLLTDEETIIMELLGRSIDDWTMYKGKTYYNNNAITSLEKTDKTLAAKVQGSKFYTVIFNFANPSYRCSCPDLKPCKHIACLVVWAMESPKHNLTEMEWQRNKPSYDFIFCANEDFSKWTPCLRKLDGTLERIKSFRELEKLNQKWHDDITFFFESEAVKQYHSKKPYHHFPNVTIRSILTHFSTCENHDLEFCNHKGSPIYFGGFLELHALIADANLQQEYQKDTEYKLHFYFLDPKAKTYRMLNQNSKQITSQEYLNLQRVYDYNHHKFYLISNKIFFLEDTKLVEQEGQTHSIIDETFDSSLTPSQNQTKITEHFDKPNAFYAFYINKNLDNIFLHNLTNTLYKKDFISKNYESLHPIFSNRLKQHFDTAWKAGPSVAISIFIEENEKEEALIKGRIEFLYAETNKYLKPENWQNKKKIKWIKDKVSSFPFTMISKDKKDQYRFIYNNNSCLIRRDIIKERSLFKETKIPFRYSKKSGEFLYSSRYVKQLVEKHLTALQEQKVILRLHESLLSLFYERAYSSTFNIEGSSEINWFSGSLKINGVSQKDQKQILKTYFKKQKLLQLSNGSWVLTEAFGLENIFKILRLSGIKMDQNGKSHLFSKGQLIGLENEEDILTLRFEEKIENLKKLFWAKLTNNLDTQLKITPHMAEVLRPYQIEGCHFFSKLFELKIGGILADDMGLGKTIQSLAFIESLLQTQKSFLFLVVSPLVAIWVWKNEIVKFTKDIPTQVWHGLQRKNEKLIKKGIIITTYATLLQDIEIFAEINFASIFFDEAQNISNSTTKSAKTIRKLKSNSFFCLTGTPVENHLSELWSLMNICFPGLLGTRTTFNELFGKRQDLQNKERLLKRIAPFVLRRKKEKILKELPKKTESLIKVELNKIQSILYEKTRKEAVDALEVAGKNYLITMLPYLMKLRRICCHPNLKNKSTLNPLESSKLCLLKEKLPEIRESASGVLIFSQFIDTLYTAGVLLKQQGEEFFYLDGSITGKKRKEMVEQFQAGKRRFFLISLKAGGTALTLHRADTVFHLDPWWNPATENQATDRTHRIGQIRQVMVYKLVAKNTIEEKVILLQEKKKKLFDSLFNEEQNTTSSITRQELFKILGEDINEQNKKKILLSQPL